ncbi:5-dehydro-4-deoxy-D-glucuronate isomerase [Nonomuraea sp. NPDC050663]|uniref:5-dehydro-4-deoxy-D-glucuronate isomerase n=1 Tax=Nonomuraea sp. NPDC050663 TaxID=3364370 RepID=UPI0037A261C3
MEARHATAPDSVETATMAQLRARYLVEELFVPGEVRGVYTHEDRMVIAGAMPDGEPLAIPSWEPVGTARHLERRELGIVNLGDPGEVTVDGVAHKLGPLDGLYAGKGSEVLMSGSGACFYLVSAPADTTYPVARFGRDQIEPVELGEDGKASRRSLYRYVWGGGHPSCRLQFGVTVVADGSVWNTIPPHLHERRTEIYLYTGLAPGERVVHLLGRPGATRHLVVADRQAVISPSWSIHAGAGSTPYAFVWAMAGENTDYGDLAPVSLESL